MIMDFWYGNSKKDAAYIDCFFYSSDCVYRGNLYDINKKIIGDFSTKDSTEIEKAFPGFSFD